MRNHARRHAGGAALQTRYASYTAVNAQAGVFASSVPSVTGWESKHSSAATQARLHDVKNADLYIDGVPAVLGYAQRQTAGTAGRSGFCWRPVCKPVRVRVRVACPTAHTCQVTASLSVARLLCSWHVCSYFCQLHNPDYLARASFANCGAHVDFVVDLYAVPTRHLVGTAHAARRSSN